MLKIQCQLFFLTQTIHAHDKLMTMAIQKLIPIAICYCDASSSYFIAALTHLHFGSAEKLRSVD